MFNELFESMSSKSVIKSILLVLGDTGYTITSGNLYDLNTDELYEIYDLFREGDSDEAILYLEDRGIEIKELE